MSPISIPGKVTLSQTQVFPDDLDAAAYVLAIEAADGQELEPAVRLAYNAFIKGCKSDGIWDAIKASCILAGARTLNGALIPLKGTAPTNYNFVAGDYDRETGLKGNSAPSSTRYLDSNRNNTTDPQNNKHITVWVTSPDTTANCSYFGAGVNQSGSSTHFGASTTGHYFNLNSSLLLVGDSYSNTGLIGASRSNSTQFVYKTGGASSPTTVANTSAAPFNETIRIFRRGNLNAAYTNARLSFYSIGESLDLALLDSRVTTLMSDIGAAIP
jgi:hypothetical protein